MQTGRFTISIIAWESIFLPSAVYSSSSCDSALIRSPRPETKTASGYFFGITDLFGIQSG